MVKSEGIFINKNRLQYSGLVITGAKAGGPLFPAYIYT